MSAAERQPLSSGSRSVLTAETAFRRPSAPMAAALIGTRSDFAEALMTSTRSQRRFWNRRRRRRSRAVRRQRRAARSRGFLDGPACRPIESGIRWAEVRRGTRMMIRCRKLPTGVWNRSAGLVGVYRTTLRSTVGLVRNDAHLSLDAACRTEKCFYFIRQMATQYHSMSKTVL